MEQWIHSLQSRRSYDGRNCINSIYQNLYGHSYHLIVERDRTHLRTKFVFDDVNMNKILQTCRKMGKQISEGEFKNY